MIEKRRKQINKGGRPEFEETGWDGRPVLVHPPTTLACRRTMNFVASSRDRHTRGQSCNELDRWLDVQTSEIQDNQVSRSTPFSIPEHDFPTTKETACVSWASSHLPCAMIQLTELNKTTNFVRKFWHFPLRASLLIFSNNIPSLTALFLFY